MPNFLKSLCALLVSPLALLLLAVLAALVWRRRRRTLLLAAGALLLVFGYPWVPGWMQSSLARHHASVTAPDARISRIVVLAAGGWGQDATLPVNQRMSGIWLHRLAEGVRLYRALPSSRLYVSISRPPDATEARRGLDELSALLGLEAQRLEPVIGAACTEDEARLAGELIGTNEFYLVTSDWHMPRALLLFRRAGMNPLPAPAAERGWGGAGPPDTAQVLPSAGNLKSAEQAVHEYLGIAWAWLKGRLR